MISVPTIYDDNEGQIGSDLSIPERRKTNWLKWFTSILSPQQWLNDLVFNKYYGGSNAADWISGNTYAYGDNVKYVDYSVYECVNLSGVTSSTPPNEDTKNWIKILDTFVGVGERVLYTGQTAKLEYLLNYYFSAPGVTLPFTRANHVDQIYIQNNALSKGFWLTQTSLQPLTGYLANNSANQTSFLYNTLSYNPYAFTIYVPSALATAITANQTSGVTYVDVISAIVDKYVQLNYKYNIVTY